MRVPISSVLIEQLNAQARQSGTTLYTLLFSLFSVFLFRYTGDEEMIIGTPVSNRGHTAFDKTVGLFANTLAIHTTLNPNATFTNYLTLFQSTITSALSAQDVPFETLVKELSPDRDLSRNPIYQVMFTLQNVQTGSSNIEGLSIEPVSNLDSLGAKFDLALEVNVHATASELHFNYSQDLFEKRTIEALSAIFNGMLERLNHHADTPINQFPLLTESDQHYQLTLGCGKVTENDDTTISEMFDKQVSKTPEKTALIYNDKYLSYQDLASLVESITENLQRSGCVQGDIVAICLPRSIEYIASVLAVVRCKAIWSPLSPALPKNRMDMLLADSNARFMMSAIASGQATIDIKTVSTVSTKALEQKEQYDPQAAYLFYTSGSSGTPKGVIGTHRGLVNRIQWMWQLYPFIENETACIKTATGFIDSLWESFGALLSGVPSLIVAETDNFDLQQFIGLVEKHKVSRLVMVPSLLTAILTQMKSGETSWPELRLCISSGEALSQELAQEFYSSFPNAKLLNLYGLSEVTADATYYEVPNSLINQDTPLGHSIDNTMIYVVDKNYALSPLGLVGDIFIAGAGLALKYHQQSELTSNAFVENPFHGGVMFKTGDRGCWNDSGFLEYSGRVDKQCKILGIRIDCGEIESTLLQLHTITRARVFPMNSGGVEKLVAHVELITAFCTDVKTVREHLKENLPNYLLPPTIVLHNEFPELSNGKIDQLTLSQTKHQELNVSNSSLINATAEQNNMLQLWGRFLGCQVTSVDDDFFNLGGHSLLAVTLLNAINEEHKSDLSVSSFFKTPTPQGCLTALTASPVSDGAESTLTSLKKGNGRQHIFMMPPSSYTSAFYQNLKNNLPDECGLLSIDSNIALEYESLESFCAQIAIDILAVQPTGPWFVGGACYGNHIALEISSQLKSLTGGDVTLLLIDSGPPLSGPTWSFQSTGQTKEQIRIVYIAKVLLSEYKRDGFRSLISYKLRTIRGKFNPVIAAYVKIGSWQRMQFVSYRGKIGTAKIVLIQSKQFRDDTQSNNRWQELSSEPVRHIAIAAKYHGELTTPNSKHWKHVANEVMAICFPIDNSS